MNILITGTTGFLGKVFLLDILDKEYDKLNKIYLLIRRKKNENSQQRFEKIASGISIISEYALDTSEAGYFDRVTDLFFLRLS